MKIKNLSKCILLFSLILNYTVEGSPIDDYRTKGVNSMEIINNLDLFTITFETKNHTGQKVTSPRFKKGKELISLAGMGRQGDPILITVRLDIPGSRGRIIGTFPGTINYDQPFVIKNQDIQKMYPANPNVTVSFSSNNDIAKAVITHSP